MARGRPLDTVPAVRKLSTTLLVLLMAVAVGCSDDDGGAGGEGSGTPTTEAVGVLAEVPVGTTVHAGGFVVDVHAVRMVRDTVGRAFVELDATITNVGPNPARFSVPSRLEGAGPPVERVEPEEPLEINPSTPVDAVIRFPVPSGVGDHGEDLDSARLVLGADGRHQAVVPFDGSAATALEPRQVEVGAVLTAGHVDLIVHGGWLRFHDPLIHENLPEGRALLELSFDAVRGEGGAPNLTADNLRLRLPDATVLAVRRDGRSAPNVLLEPDVPATGLTARFEVPEGTAGDHALVLVGPYGDAGAEVRGELAFTVGSG